MRAPEVLQFVQGGYLNGGRALELVDGVLRWTPQEGAWGHAPFCLPGEVRPDAEAWGRFRAAIDDLNVWGWETRYEDPRILDGSYWRLLVNWAGRTIDASGANAYPAGWRVFRSALDRLTSTSAPI